jgi:hypothetical protein
MPVRGRASTDVGRQRLQLAHARPRSPAYSGQAGIQQHRCSRAPSGRHLGPDEPGALFGDGRHDDWAVGLAIVEAAEAPGEEVTLGVDAWNLPLAQIFEVNGAAAAADLWTPRYHRPIAVALVKTLLRDFKCSTVRQLASVERGKGTRVSDYATKGIPFIRTSSLINFGIDPFPDHYASNDIHELFDQQVHVGDILFSIEGKIGSVGYLTEEDTCVFKNHIELVRANEETDSLYLFLVLASRIGLLQATRNTVVQETLPGMAGRLRAIVVRLSPLNPQRRQQFKDGVTRP